MEFKRSKQKCLSCQPSTSRNKNDDDEIEIDNGEYVGTEMKDEEEEYEFQTNETDSSSDDDIKTVYHSSYRGNQWEKGDNGQIAITDKADDFGDSTSRLCQWNENLEEFGNSETSTSAALHRELRNLSFRSPGYRCTLPVPLRVKRTVVIEQQSKTFSESSAADRRSKRKRMAKRDESRSAEVQTRSMNTKVRYNNKGRLVAPGRNEVDLCDCLDQKCNGCQFQCKKCGGNKCSYACRINRTTFIEHIDTLGGSRTKNPFL